ncbi:hypothetical protein [Nocardia cyriacigeorgica]|uniref:hypothetical protein n=1 Tax=Nocardia cyriacigeorgica TaxID=135487 RepID=UPI001895E216|nr:hypothetical protein [Nocardia cyriacigeorgica]MBF6323916.1 hypothetical protein [Nocardia cyriacigeorgica]MBF6324784.1 hypothetical protein [Nocardia cyriacigeorgica]
MPDDVLRSLNRDEVLRVLVDGLGPYLEAAEPIRSIARATAATLDGDDSGEFHRLLTTYDNKLRVLRACHRALTAIDKPSSDAH